MRNKSAKSVFLHLSQRCSATTLEAKSIFVIYRLHPHAHLLTQTADVWHNPSGEKVTRALGWAGVGGYQTERQRGSVAVYSSLTDNVMIRGIGSLFVSELLLCSSDPYDTSSGSLQLISIKPIVAQTNYSHPASSDRSQDSAIVNGEVISD